MKDFVLQSVKEFLHLNYLPENSLLLGFSGGTDSLALLHLLLECKQFFPVDIHLAHLDHGWRKESFSEALKLKSYATSLDLPFYWRSLQDQRERKGNLEEFGRRERLLFFQELWSQRKFQAVLLAHQADDQAETLLKRILEGASLYSLGGMQPISQIQEMTIWRPLLTFRKKELITWLEKRNLKGIIEDETNRDPRFLRARMRRFIFPYIESQFGKSAVSNLSRLGRNSFEFKKYLEKKILPFMEKIQKGILGAYLDLSADFLEKVECETLFRKIFSEEKITLSSEHFEYLTLWVQKKSANKRIVGKEWRIFIDRGVVFWNPCPFAMPSCKVALISQKLRIQEFQWTIRCGEHSKESAISNWKQFWAGRMNFWLPEGEYEIVPPSEQVLKEVGTRLKKWWSDYSVPVFLRQMAPLILKDGKLMHECLSGNYFHSPINEKCNRNININIEIKKIDN